MKTEKSTPCYGYVYSINNGVAKLVTKPSRQYSSVGNARRAMRASRYIGNGYMRIVDTKSLAFEMTEEMLTKRICSSKGF